MSVEQLEESVLKLSIEERRRFIGWLQEHELELIGNDIDLGVRAEILRRRDEADARPELIEPWEGTTERNRARLNELRRQKTQAG